MIYLRPVARLWPGWLALAVLMCAPAAMGQEIKWEQLPNWDERNDIYLGWNEFSVAGIQIAADDWVCETTDPVTDVHWWGSYLGWCGTGTTEPLRPEYFHITIWTDVPAGADLPWSHPGIVLWEYDCYDYQEVFVGWDYDPRARCLEACYEYTCILPQSNWFYQDPGENIYWVSIAAVYPPCGCNADLNGDGVVNMMDVTIMNNCLFQPPVGECLPADQDCDGDIDDDDLMIFMCLFEGSPPIECCPHLYDFEHPWGWKARPRVDSVAPDAAVTVFEPTFPHPGDSIGPEASFPLTWPGQYPADQWDLAFELTSQFGGPLTKWDQPPTEDNPFVPECFYGWDEVLEWGFVIGAADWVCTTPEPVKDVHWWGSYAGWTEPGPPPQFPPDAWIMTIWSDAGGVPGCVIWQHFAPGPEVQEVVVGCDYHPDYGRDTCFYYSYDIPEPEWFYQPMVEERFWFSVVPLYMAAPPEFPWGWKTTLKGIDQFPGFRIFEPAAPAIGDCAQFFDILMTPQGEPWDYAFRLTSDSGVVQPYVKWSQPPEPYPMPVVIGYDELSVFGGEKIVADDWLCVDARPVTDIHWWGSFIGWQCEVPPQLPDYFEIAFWRDVPVGPHPFSHPGEVVKTIRVDAYDLAFVGWEFPPCDVGIVGDVPEACFRFDTVLEPEQYFKQGPGEHIWWISIAAVYVDVTDVEYPFGWKSRESVPSPILDAAIDIFDPTMPQEGEVFLQGLPIMHCGGVPYDLAYVLTTCPMTCADMNCDCVVDVFDINPFVQAILDPVGYAAAYPHCDINNGDVNADGAIDVFDINPFVDELLNGTGCVW